MCERLLNLQEIYVSGQNICIEVYGNSVGTITPNMLLLFVPYFFHFSLSNFQALKVFVGVFSEIVRPRRLKLHTNMNSG